LARIYLSNRLTGTQAKPFLLPVLLLVQLGGAMGTGFSLFKRGKESGAGKYYVRFFDEAGELIKTMASGESSKAAATLFAQKIIDQGFLKSCHDPFIKDFLQDFWADDSRYVKLEANRGRNLTLGHLKKSRDVASKQVIPYLGKKRLSDIRPTDIEDWMIMLSENGVGARTINLALQALSTPYRIFVRNHRLPDAISGTRRFREKKEERGILTLKEIKNISSVDDSPRAICAVLLGCLAGLRLGEVRGIQINDIDLYSNIINIQHNVPSSTFQLTTPKCNSTRTIPIHPLLRPSILNCIAANNSSSFLIFNSNDCSRPQEENTIRKSFFRILNKIGIDETMIKERNLVFHSLRHSFITNCCNSGIDLYLVKMMAGHKTTKMTELYSNHHSKIDYTNVINIFKEDR
jgi:integrase